MAWRGVAHVGVCVCLFLPWPPRRGRTDGGSRFTHKTLFKTVKHRCRFEVGHGPVSLPPPKDKSYTLALCLSSILLVVSTWERDSYPN